MQHPSCAVSFYTTHRPGKLRGLPRSRSAWSQKDCSNALDSYRCTPLQQKLRESTCAVPGPRQCPHPLTEDTGQRGGMACQPCPRQHTWLQRASRQLQGQGEREKEDTVVSLEQACAHSVCNDVRWRPCPTNLPPPPHHSPTPVHTCKRPPHVFFPKPRQLRYLGHAAPLTA